MPGELMAPEAIAERNRIRDALRRIANRYQDAGSCITEPPELTIRRTIEELFSSPVSDDVQLPTKARW